MQPTHSGVNATTTRVRLPQNSPVIKDSLGNCPESTSVKAPAVMFVGLVLIEETLVLLVLCD